MKDFIILADTRQQKDNHIIKEFDKQGFLHIRTGLPSADYMAIRFDKEKGFYMDYTTLIDTKKDLEEISSNLCNSKNHERIKREIAKARELGCKNFIFLIANDKIETIQDLQNWSSKRTRVTGKVLCKVMNTMSKKYGIRFMICKKRKMGEKVIKILERKK